MLTYIVSVFDGVPALSKPPNTRPILPLFIVTVISPYVYGTCVAVPFPPPNTELAIVPLLTVTEVEPFLFTET